MNERLTERIDNVPNGESRVWVKNHDYISAVEKLADYEDFEEQGLLLRLPCKVGDTIYEIIDECEGDSAGCYRTCDNCNNRRLGIEETKFSIDILDEFGDWYFLTQSEAEEKLRELEKSNV